MDSHIVLAATRISTFEGLTAFSALPNAPVLPEPPVRFAGVRSLLGRLAPTRQTGRVAPAPAAPSRMTACV